MILQDLKKELGEKLKDNKLSRRKKILVEQAIYNDLLELENKCCKCPRTENLTLDHIVPQSILTSFGIDIDTEVVEDNYQILCRPCNTFKANRLDFSTPKTKEVILKLLEKI